MKTPDEFRRRIELKQQLIDIAKKEILDLEAQIREIERKEAVAGPHK